MDANTALVNFTPFILLGLIIGVLMAVAASKVGRSPVLWFILGALPFVNMFFIWIAPWSVLIEMHRRLKAMERA